MNRIFEQRVATLERTMGIFAEAVRELRAVRRMRSDRPCRIAERERKWLAVRSMFVDCFEFAF